MVMPSALRCSQRENALIRDITALDKSDTLQFGKGGKLHDTVIREILAAREIDVSNPVAELDELYNAEIADAGTVA